ARPGLHVMRRRDVGEGRQSVLGCPQARTRGQDSIPVLRLPFVDPHQAVADRLVEAGRPGIGPPPVLAVPAMHVLVGEAVAAWEGRLPFFEIARQAGDLAGSVMLDTDAADFVAE